MPGDWKIGQKVAAIALASRAPQCHQCGGGGLEYIEETATHDACGGCAGTGDGPLVSTWGLLGTGRHQVVEVAIAPGGAEELCLLELATGSGRAGSPMYARVLAADVFPSKELALQECQARNAP